MGYRTYIGFMPKREYNKIKSMTEQQLIEFYNIEIENDDPMDEECGYWHKGSWEYGTELHEFGKYTDFEPPKKSIKPFFKNKDLLERYEEGDLYIVTPEFLECIIESYKKRIADYYNDMMMPFFGKKDSFRDREQATDFLNSIETEYNYPNNKYTFDFTKITQDEQNSLFKIIEHVRSMRMEWTLIAPYDLGQREPISTSSKFEYQIFELVRIYKSFDWKKNVMIYYGY